MRDALVRGRNLGDLITASKHHVLMRRYVLQQCVDARGPARKAWMADEVEEPRVLVRGIELFDPCLNHVTGSDQSPWESVISGVVINPGPRKLDERFFTVVGNMHPVRHVFIREGVVVLVPGFKNCLQHGRSRESGGSSPALR